jgi:putative phage-type endonuclease
MTKICSLFYKYTYKNISRNLIMTNMENYNSIIDIDKKIIENLKNSNKDIIDFIEYKSEDITNDLVIKRIEDINNYRQELKNLVNTPIIKQRTPEWLEARKTRLTASDLYDAIKNNKNSDNIAKKKANILKDNINYNAIKALKWGTMFEPMATRAYSNINNKVHIYDFGLICDPNNEHFGASPDGINELGIMIEIKCPYSREIINDYVPEKYKLQIQGQLAVCNLKECDYIECKFLIIEEDNIYIEEFSDKYTNHGIIAEYIKKSSKEYYYLYSDDDINASDAIGNIYSKIADFNIENEKDGNKYEFVKFNYWKLDKINVQRIIFDNENWKNINNKINIFWEKVENYKKLPIDKFKFVNDDEED